MKSLNVLPQEARQELARRELKRRKARKELIRFNEFVYPGYKVSWHIETLCLALEHIISGAIRFLIVEMPPRHSKSLNVSQLFPAFIVGDDPDATIIVSSYSGDLATDHGRETREIINSEEYQQLFSTRLATDSKAKSKWNTVVVDRDGKQKKAKGAYNAAGVGGSITGKGAKYFVIDDPLKDRKEADSELIRDDRFRWLRSVARTRLTPDGRMVIMHTRWHDDDMIGRLTEEDSEYKEPWIDFFDFLEDLKKLENERRPFKWVRLRLPAIAEVDEPNRKAGEALWPDHYNLAELEDIKKTLGTYEWSALYQQNPVDEESRDFRKEWFRTRELSELKGVPTRNYLTVDPRGKDDVKNGKDFIGLTRNYVDPEGKYNLRSERIKLTSKELIDLVFKWHVEDKYEKIGFEDTQFYQGMKALLAEEMQRRGVYLPIVELTHTIQKELRILALQPRYEYGGINHITIDGRNQCVDLEEELLHFPKATFDDASDSAASQQEIAASPLLSVGDRLLRTEVEKCISANVNAQEEPVVIGVSGGHPLKIVIGNDAGVFYNGVLTASNPYQQLEHIMRRWRQAFVVAVQGGDVVGVKVLEGSFPGRVFALNTSDTDSNTDPKWDITKMDVRVNRSGVIQSIIDELRDKRITMFGTLEDWEPVLSDLLSIRREWKEENGKRKYVWEGPPSLHYLEAMICYRVGIDKYAKTAAKVVGMTDGLGELPVGRFFTE